MKKQWKIKNEIKWTVSLVGLVALVIFAERKHADIVCKDIVVQLDNVQENHFMNEKDALQIVEATQSNLRGKKFSEINLKQFETQLIRNKHVKDAELFSDLKGNLIVNVQLRRPIARLVQDDGPDAYIAEDGTVMPTSSDFTSRVIIISGEYVKTILTHQNMNEFEEGKQLMEMIGFINEDKFWEAQASQLDINKAGKVFIIPQVTDQLVEFGKPEEIEEKFMKLKVFYTKVLPQMGWNKYERVNLEFKGQVVAE